MLYAHKVSPGDKVRLKGFDASEHAGLSKEDGEVMAAEYGDEMAKLQDLLFAAGETALLVVLQGMDTSGKDGAIRHVSRYVNAQSCRVAPFKAPNERELAHDFLWRVHMQTPAKGEMAIFNRSHYEDVLVARVHELVAPDVWKRRYDQINAFEKLLVESGTVVLKFFLHIDKEEQEQRLLDREKDAPKAWKLAVGDWKERERWGDYQEAYEEALSRCSTHEAPWYVVPANHKWFRDLAISERIVHALRPFRNKWARRLEEVGLQARAEIEAYRRERAP